VFLNARGNRLPELLATDLAATAIGRPLNIRAVTLPDDVLRTYAGVYQDRTHTPVTITLESGRLTYQKTGGPRWSMTPYARDKVFFDNTSTIGEFRRDAQGRITGFVMQTLRGQDRNELLREPVRE